MEQLGGGWGVFAVVFGIAAILCAIGTCLLGFWLSTVRLMYAMGENNFLPKVFTKVNRHQQPILPNILLLAISLVFLLLQNATTFMNDFFNLMSFGCACAYAITMISAMRIHKSYPELRATYLQTQGRQLHPGGWRSWHSPRGHRFLLHPGPEHQLPGRARQSTSASAGFAVAVDGAGELGRAQGHHRNGGRHQRILIPS
ncbi:MAG: amino acid permease [Oscillospiraceae bacterium]